MPRPARIDRHDVLRAGLEVADATGIASLTMQRVADRLSVSVMGLYRHVRNKADLLDGLVEELLSEIPPPPADLPWDRRIADLGRSLRACARRHPDVFALLLQRPIRTPGSRAARDSAYTALRDAGLADGSVEQAERIVSTLIIGFCISEVSGRFAGPPAVVDADFSRMQEVVLDVVRRLAVTPV